jgi:multimeric flavodoxin WrbA
MKAVIVSGSRNPQGQTARAAGALAEGLAGAGAECQIIFLPAKRVERCRQCDAAGWGLCRQEGRCVLEDDFAEIVGAIRMADIVVFATPVYFSDLSESLRAFLDRVRRITRIESAKTDLAGKAAVGVCVAGGGGGGAPSCCLNLERILATCGFDVVDVVPVRRQNLDMRIRRGGRGPRPSAEPGHEVRGPADGRQMAGDARQGVSPCVAGVLFEPEPQSRRLPARSESRCTSGLPS